MAPMIMASSAAHMPSILSPCFAIRLWVTLKPSCGSQLAGWVSRSLTSGKALRPSLKPATRVWLVLLSSTPASARTLPFPPMPSASFFARHRPLSTPECFWKATKWSPSCAGSMLSGLFHQMVTKPPDCLTDFTIGATSEFATVFTMRTTFLPSAMMAWILEISTWELPWESTISKGTSSLADSALAPSIMEAM